MSPTRSPFGPFVKDEVVCTDEDDDGFRMCDRRRDTVGSERGASE